jgi:hypothetical protein
MQSTHSPYSNTYEDDDAHVRRANPEWREDPERREAARVRAEEVRAAHAEAHALLKQAVDVLRAVGPLNPYEDATVLRASRNLGVTLVQFDRDAKGLAEPLNETAVGNRAAFGYAWPPAKANG